ncbi:MAG: hypothetical protein QNK87_05905 [Octadecabacter sp.]
MSSTWARTRLISRTLCEWAAQWGGVYLFRDAAEPAAIVMGDRAALADLNIKTVVGGDQRSSIAQFLKVNDLVPEDGFCGRGCGDIIGRGFERGHAARPARLGSAVL